MRRDTVTINEDNYLTCPVCQYDYLHHQWVETIFRDSEDSDGTSVRTSMENIKIIRVDDKEIPGRRNVIHIDFWCEGCHKRSVLQIIQHKGNTIIEWIKDGYKTTPASETN